MRKVDDALEPLIKAAIGHTTQQPRFHHAEVTADNHTKVVTYDLPYVVYSSSYGDDDTLRNRRRTRRSVFVALKYVGESPDQVKWAIERVRGRLQDQRVPLEGHRVWPIRLLLSTRVWRDDDAIRPDGSPLFYADEQYEFPMTLSVFQSNPVMQEATP